MIRQADYRLKEYVLNRASPTAPGLVGWWPGRFPGAGVVHDLSGYGHTGTWYGAGTHWVADGERQRHVMSFNGSDDYLALATPITIPLNGDFTLAAWVWLDSLALDNPVILGFDETINGLRIDKTTGKVTCRISDLSKICTQSGIPVQTWTHVVATRTSNILAGYINGVDDTPGPAPSQAGTVPVTWIGCSVGGGSPARFWGGMLDDLRVHNRALSASEIRTIYDRGRVAPLSDLAVSEDWGVFPPPAVSGPSLPLINGGLINAGLIGGGLIR